MNDEYEYGPWIGWNGDQNPPHPNDTVQVVMFGGLGQLRWENIKSFDVTWSRGNVIAYRIATPKPKRELVVGKWYYAATSQVWRKVIAVNEGGAWLERDDDPGSATLWSMDSVLSIIDWSTPPRDEAPE